MAATASVVSNTPLRVESRTGRMAMVLILTDFATTWLAMLVGFRIWSWFNPLRPPIHPVIALAPFFLVFVFAFENLYPCVGIHPVEVLRRELRGVLLAYLMLAASVFLTKGDWDNSRGGVILAFLISLLVVPVGRRFCGALFDHLDWWGVPVLIGGTGAAATSLIRALQSTRALGFRPVLCVTDREGVHHCEGVPVAGRFEDAPTLAKQYGIRYAVIAMSTISRERLQQYLHRWAPVFHNIAIVPNLFETNGLWIEPRDLDGLLGLEVRHNLLMPGARRFKRVMDVIGALAGILVLAPFFFVSHRSMHRLAHVLKGKASLVGPLPEKRYLPGERDPELLVLRARVQPGLTGLWNIGMLRETSLNAQMALDSYYIRNWTAWLDLYILIRQARRTLFGKRED